jgi:hypothetical protein
MKTQAWAWLAAAVLAAGLNASYHDGGMQWAHRIADQMDHGTSAVMALASGRTDQFLTEMRMASTHDDAPSCQFATSVARVQARLARTQTRVVRFEGMTALQEAQFARLEANREYVISRLEAETNRMRIPAVTLSPVVARVPQISVCPRIHVSVPAMPVIHVPTPEIHVDAGLGPI